MKLWMIPGWKPAYGRLVMAALVVLAILASGWDIALALIAMWALFEALSWLFHKAVDRVLYGNETAQQKQARLRTEARIEEMERYRRDRHLGASPP